MVSSPNHIHSFLLLLLFNGCAQFRSVLCCEGRSAPRAGVNSYGGGGIEGWWNGLDAHVSLVVFFGGRGLSNPIELVPSTL